MSKQKQPRNAINGWVNLNKPLGITSSDAVNKVKWLLKPEKIGHAGTLDPLASGVLPLALGEGTKCVNLLMDAKKTYEFSVTFGERRSTDDAEGEVVATSDHIPTEAEIRTILPRFTGPILQMPPAYSALKIDGKRAYDLARAGEEVVLKERPVTIHALEFLGFEGEAGAVGKPSPLGGEGLDEGTLNKAESHLHTPSPNPLPQGERASLGSPTGDSHPQTSMRLHVPLATREQAIDRSQALRRDSTEVEQKLWNILRGRRLEGLKFRRQHPFGNYIVDFICLEQQLVIELDGGQHSSAENYDAKRTAYIESQGFRVIRFWNHEVLENVEGVLETIRAELHRPLTQPSPSRGEGSTMAPVQANNGHLSNNKQPVIGKFRAVVSKGTYIRSLGRDMAVACGSEGYISRLHRAAVGPFTDSAAISLDLLENSVHNAPPSGETPWLTPLERALDDIPAISIDGGQLTRLRHGQRATLSTPTPDMPQIAVLHEGKLVALARTEGNQVISTRMLNVDV